MKSVGASGIGSGFQRIWSGETGTSPKRSWKRGWANGSKRPCIAAGRIRYSQLRRLLPRGAVNALPVSCSAYRPCATFCGELRPTGRVPAIASVANSLPNPDMYPSTLPPETRKAPLGHIDPDDAARQILLPRIHADDADQPRAAMDSLPCSAWIRGIRVIRGQVLQHPALHLVALDALEQGLEVAFAEAFIALALDDLEEDRAERVGGEDLQQLALPGFRVGVDQDLVLRQPRQVLAVVRDALLDHLEIGVRRVQEFHALRAHLLDRFV